MRELSNLATELTPAPLGNKTPDQMEAWLTTRADRLGMSLDELRERDLEAVAKAAYPTPECLDPLEVEQFLSRELSPAKQEHLAKCAMCATLVEVANPPRAFYDTVLSPLLQRAEPEQTFAAQSRFMPVVATGAAAVVVCFSAVGLWIYSRQDALLSELLRDQALKMLFQVTGCTAALVFVAVLTSRTILSHQARLIGGISMVLLFFCAVTFFSLRDFSTVMAQHSDMRATQIALMSKLVTNGNQATLVSEEAPGRLPGRLVAEKSGLKSFDVRWDKSEEGGSNAIKPREPPVAKIYACKIQREKGMLGLCTNAYVKLKVAGTAADPRIKNGEDVLALMPDNTSSVSMVLPLQAAAYR